MAAIIKWSDEAKKTFDRNIKYLQQEWTDREIKNFIIQTNNILSGIVAHPEMYAASAKSVNIRKAQINKYIVLYYRNYTAKKEVILLTFWHNKQDPRKMKY